MAKYSERILKLVSYVTAGETVSDIGPDHGYLGEWLIKNQVSPLVIMTDIAEGPLFTARESAERYAPGDAVDFRLGDGLAPLANGEVDTVVIAGMGGETIAYILGADPVKTMSFAKYILQPRTKADELREWLSGRIALSWQDNAPAREALMHLRFDILSNDIAVERGRNCEIIVVRPVHIKGDDNNAGKKR